MADNKYLKRKFTTREIILLIVLFIVLFIGLYFALVYYPLRQANQDLDEQLGDVDQKLVVAQALKNNYDNQKAALESFKASGTAKMPKCTDEQQKVLYNHFVVTVFGREDFARFSWSTPTEPDAGVRQRRVSISFTVSEADVSGAAGQTVYDRTVSMLHGLMNSGFRCAMTALSLSAEGGDSLETATSINVSTSITFYELDA